MSTYKPQRIKVRSGVQSTGHKTYCIGVPWQIAEAIPERQTFMPKMDETSGRMTFSPVDEPDQFVPFGRVMAALAVSGADHETMSRCMAMIRELGRTAHTNDRIDPDLLDRTIG